LFKVNVNNVHLYITIITTIDVVGLCHLCWNRSSFTKV